MQQEEMRGEEGTRSQEKIIVKAIVCRRSAITMEEIGKRSTQICKSVHSSDNLQPHRHPFQRKHNPYSRSCCMNKLQERISVFLVLDCKQRSRCIIDCTDPSFSITLILLSSQYHHIIIIPTKTLPLPQPDEMREETKSEMPLKYPYYQLLCFLLGIGIVSSSRNGFQQKA